ncbi:sensor histidine kinase [Caulobacter endophyticus]|uniref:sensor histidine kinase n=1 Tax=Caulobacter endophyticus TaxID=2172652 RepID=UPI00240EA551|nr:PAS domain S-box protein [Caulobacter endophyticus]MDG2527700.1 PAS domain S-box protein [Caulobacter endophyticus]
MGGRGAQSGGAGEEARYRAIVDTAVDAIVVIDEHGRIEAFNPAAERLFGYAASDMIGSNVNGLMPEPHHAAHDGYLDTYRRTGERRIIGIGREVFGRRQDGSTFPLELSIAEWRSGGRRFFTGVMRDVTERKRAEELQRLLVNELNHRVKNTLATVQSVAGQTLRNAADLGDARESLTTRLLALARTHDILTRESWDGADLHDIMAGLVDSYGDASRFELAGPPVRLSPKTALSLSLALHELTTNAAKYGALSQSTGQVRVVWSREGEGDDERLRLLWRETGGPPVSPPERQGFGSRLITRGLALELDGEAALDYPSEGVVCTIVARIRRRPAAQPAPARGAA